MRLRLGVNVSAPPLYGLGWILGAAAVVLAVLALATLLGVERLPAAPVAELTGAAIWAPLALACRALGRRFEHAL